MDQSRMKRQSSTSSGQHSWGIENRTSNPFVTNDDVSSQSQSSSGSSSIRFLLRRWRTSVSGSISPTKRIRKRNLWRWLFKIICTLIVLGVLAAITYVSLVAALIHRLNPPRINSGLQRLVQQWQESDSKGAWQFPWPDNFSRDIVPKACHSHNDYWRSVPLYQALAAGCLGIEADVWLQPNNELFIGHSASSLKPACTFRTLYLDPLTNILTNRNASMASLEEKEVGIFDEDPNASVVLLIDFKTDGAELWPVVRSQLAPLHSEGWLTYFNGTMLIPGPITAVGTGNTPFDLVQANSTDRYIFFDAPLSEISNNIYTAENSYYASVQMRKAVGPIWFNRLSGSQVKMIKSQIQAAEAKGLKARYWGTPSWPISLRDKVWSTLTENRVGMLNVDDLISATRWNWNWCVIAGLTLCGHS